MGNLKIYVTVNRTSGYFQLLVAEITNDWNLLAKVITRIDLNIPEGVMDLNRADVPFDEHAAAKFKKLTELWPNKMQNPPNE